MSDKGFDYSSSEAGLQIEWGKIAGPIHFHCTCGEDSEYDGRLASVLKCPHCQSQWELPVVVFPRKIMSDGTAPMITLEVDESDLATE